jgi:hypothetical protein
MFNITCFCFGQGMASAMDTLVILFFIV